MYESLVGGYLVPLYLVRRSEAWSGGLIVTYPRIQGDFALRMATLSAGTATASSEYAVNMTDFYGVGLVTYSPDATPLSLATIRFYTTYNDADGPPHYYQFQWSPSATSGTGTDQYGSGAYGVAKYGYDQSIEFGDWYILTVPKTSFEAVGTPSWGRIEAVEIILDTTAAGEIFFDAVSGWVQLETEEASANQLISNLPEYHWDQGFNDAIAQEVGYELDALDANVLESLPQSVPSLSSRMLYRLEEVLGLTPNPTQLTDVQRRGFIQALLSQPVTLAEMTTALSRACGAAISLIEHTPSYTVYVTAPINPADVPGSTAPALFVACKRLLPAHLGIRIDYDTFIAGDLAGDGVGTYYLDGGSTADLTLTDSTGTVT